MDMVGLGNMVEVHHVHRVLIRLLAVIALLLGHLRQDTARIAVRQVECVVGQSGRGKQNNTDKGKGADHGRLLKQMSTTPCHSHVTV